MKLALVIGGSDGIGLELTRRLLDAGWRVRGVSRSPAPVEHERYRQTAVDVSSEGYIPKLRALAEEQLPDACVWCVGMGETFALDKMQDDVRTMQVNLVAAVATASVLAPLMVERGRGRLVFLSSQGDVLVSPQSPAYTASKAGLSKYVEGLALALRPRGVLVTNVRFGFVDTKMAKSAVRPFMMSVKSAADVLLRTLDSRAVRVTRPLAMAALMWLLAWFTDWRVRLG